MSSQGKSWSNAEAVCPRLLTHGVFTDPDDLAVQMLACVEHYNLTAKSFRWTYTGKLLAA